MIARWNVHWVIAWRHFSFHNQVSCVFTNPRVISKVVVFTNPRVISKVVAFNVLYALQGQLPTLITAIRYKADWNVLQLHWRLQDKEFVYLMEKAGAAAGHAYTPTPIRGQTIPDYQTMEYHSDGSDVKMLWNESIQS